MPTRFARSPIVLACFLLCLMVAPLMACQILPSLTGNGTPSATTPTTADQNGQAVDVWNKVAPGIEIRYEDWKSPGDNDDKVTILRLDPKHVHLSIGYKPDHSPSLSEWMKQTHALAVLNGGYFDEHNNPAGLLVSNGEAHGTSYQGFGGMLSVDGDGSIHLRSLRDTPYDPNNEQLQQATQSSPMLMVNGQRTTFNANAVSDRRTVVARDKQGRLLMILSPGRAFTLDELADLLVSSDLSLQDALNLDGGASTGLYLNAGGQKVTIDPITTLPIVIIIK